MIPYATVIEGRRQWNGKIGEEMVANVTDDDINRVIETGTRPLRRKPR